jgi:hypothetical protein
MSGRRTGKAGEMGTHFIEGGIALTIRRKNV